MTTPSQRQRGPKATRVDTGRILDAAQEAFSEVGLQGASIRAIAQRAGCDPSLIYYHFESKEALLLALLDRKVPELAGPMARIADPANPHSTLERLWAVMGVYRTQFGRDPGFRSVIRGEITRGTGNLREAIAQRLRPVVSCLWQVLQQGQARGEVRPDLDPQLGGFFFGKLYLEILEVIPAMAQPMMGRDPHQALLRAERAWMELYWRGIASDPSLPFPALPAFEDHP